MSKNVSYPVVETFHTIQGEGYFSGHSAYFIRLAGCDVGCSWCDVKESWEESDHPFESVDQMAEKASESGAHIVVVTGGEPTMHDLKPLTDALHEKGLKCHLETAGVNPLTGDWDWICFSPKKFKAPLDEIYDLCNELKIVVLNKHDLIWAEEHAKKANSDCVLLLQPEWNKRESVAPTILNYMGDHPKWRISLQLHKYLGVS